LKICTATAGISINMPNAGDYQDTFHDASNSTGHRGRFNAIKRVGISYLSRAFSALWVSCEMKDFRRRVCPFRH
jgi:hypothetical protein